MQIGRKKIKDKNTYHVLSMSDEENIEISRSSSLSNDDTKIVTINHKESHLRRRRKRNTIKKKIKRLNGDP